MKLGGIRAGQNTKASQDANLHFEVTRSKAAELLNVSERTIRTVKAVEKAALELKFYY